MTAQAAGGGWHSAAGGRNRRQIQAKWTLITEHGVLHDIAWHAVSNRVHTDKAQSTHTGCGPSGEMATSYKSHALYQSIHMGSRFQMQRPQQCRQRLLRSVLLARGEQGGQDLACDVHRRHTHAVPAARVVGHELPLPTGHLAKGVAGARWAFGSVLCGCSRRRGRSTATLG